MQSEKKRKRAGRDRAVTIHPRNRYADKPPDFSLLASLYPSFSSFIFYSPRDGLPRIDWTDFNATRELTRVLLLHDHGLNWWIPDGQLCPTVPNRSNYIHWIEDLLASDIIPKTSLDHDKVRGFDIGTGTNCIYPLLGASLLGWSFVGSDVTPVALEWADKNVNSNPQISHLIEIRKAERAEAAEDADGVNGSRKEVSTQNNPCILVSAETWTSVESSAHHTERTLDGIELPGVVDKVEFGDVESEGLERELSSNDHEDVDKRYNGPPVLLGVVKDGEKFDFCMCNPPFFENMEESGQNVKTACGGTAEEMVCNGGERAFISRIIEDSVVLKHSFRWYTSMVGKKSNLKFLIAKLRWEGATIVKTTEFVQGRTSRWGLAWSFVAPSIKLVPSHAAQKNNMSFMLEGLPRQVGAYNVLQSVESFFCNFGASSNLNPSSFTVDLNLSNHHCDAILKNKADDVMNSSQRTDELSSCLPDSMDQLSFRVSVFQQIPGSLLVKGSVQQRNSPVLGMLSVVFKSLEDFIRCKFCKEKTLMLNHLNQNRTR